jgi:hypothetical protein
VIRRYDMRRSDNFPVSGIMFVTCMSDTMFVPCGFPLTTALITLIEGTQVSLEKVEGNGFRIRFANGYVRGSTSKFQYMVS